MKIKYVINNIQRKISGEKRNTYFAMIPIIKHGKAELTFLGSEYNLIRSKT